MKIAIDGPSGAGKSTLAKMAAERLGYTYVDTGALYRCIGLYMLRAGICCKDLDAVCQSIKDINIDLLYDDNGYQKMLLNGVDVTAEIRTPQVSMAASEVSAFPEVRSFLLDLQRDIANKYSVIMDGRDIGTVVLPDADVKIFLTASAKVRAERRYEELLAKGLDVAYSDVLKDIIKRDQQDSDREISPLKPAPDSVLLDTTEYTLSESLERIIQLIKEVESCG